DFGLTLPHLPQVVAGYEYQFRDGSKSMLEWGNVDGKNIYPAAKSIDEQTHVIKLNVMHDFYGIHLEDNARVEFYDLKTSTEDLKNPLTLPPPPGSVRTYQDATHIQGQNALHLERQFTDQLLVSAGYLYSKLDGDSSFSQTTINSSGVPVPGLFWSSDEILLK